jgi:glycosyltransferase involved in cell wall biosynthesis
MPELASDAALLVNPLVLDEITVTMQSLISDPHLHERLRLAGIKKAQAFTWQKTALATQAIYQQFL